METIDECFANVTVTGTEEEGYTFLYFMDYWKKRR